MENLRGKAFRHVIITIGLLLHLHHQVALQTVPLTQPYSGECEEEDTIIGEEPIALLCRNNETDIVHNRAELQLDVDPGAFTCGLDGSEDFCTLAVVSECDRCANQNAYKRHVKEMMVDNLGTETWWQSITWSKIYPNPLEINVTFTYGDKLYELASDIEITFQSARPRTMVLWSSKDNGITWDPLQYYSSNRCPTFVRTRGVKTFFSRADLAAVVCTDKYSSVLPSSGGKVIFPLSERLDLVRRAGGSTALYSELARNDALQNFTLFNVLRIQLLHPATDGREIYGGDPSTYLKYYYGISDIEVTARCWCNLHGKCIDVGDREACQCKHNTAGTNCERCLPMFNELPWRRGSYLPYPIGTPNECMRCNCNNHAQTCVFNPLTSSGRCLDCTDNTTGEKCEKCLPGYYRNETAALNSSEVCLQCDCESLGTLDPNATCLTESNALTGQVSGQCMCRRGIVGQRCDLCGDGFYGLLVEPDIGTCKACACNRHGTVDASNVCNKTTGQCNCKPGITNRACDQCKEGYNSFPFGRLTGDCTACGCDPGGSFGLSCEPRQGQCKCRKNFIGQRCNQPRIGTFTPSLDAFSFKPKDTDCRNTSALRTQRRYTDRYFHVCEQQQFMGFGTIQGLRQLAAEW
ncbi:PREDICTED: laminin subunit gamma-1-like [Priapulus caudatus]|uniref:Laminin subunit gamma-1-like n=1 Tax=Priapulus caudatus TaxID=37621 RepID=A0ABM1ES42_PRICU|nr:PREDICTED: laminin subunit gamma-1-like [Priapulus caudatus]